MGSGDPGPWETVSAFLPDPFPGEYRLIRRIGEGAYGTVWLAEDVRLGRPVALKTLKVPTTSTHGPQALAALAKDARFLARVPHPNIVQVYAWRTARDEHYLVLQFVEGGSFAGRLAQDGPLDWQQAARYVADVAEALLEAHACGVIHRDIKPANILWDQQHDEAKLTDFGVSAHLSEPGSVSGTPAYMAPEAWDGRVSPALDVFSLAATFFHLVTGKLPFPGKGEDELREQIRRGLPDPDPRCQDLPGPLERIIRAGLADETVHRPSLRAFLDDLRGELNRLLIDGMAASTPARPSAPVNLTLRVSRKVDDTTYQPVPTSPPRRLRVSRDAKKKVPPPPEQVRLRTGDTVRFEVSADREGYLAVFNVGPTGNLNLLYPDEPPEAPPRHVPGPAPLTIDDVEMTPPAGRERMFAVWSLSPLRLDQLQSLADRDEAIGSRSYYATRDMKRLKEALQQLPSEEVHAVVLELDHLP